MFIKNRDILLNENIPQKNLELRRILIDVLERALDAVKPKILIKRAVIIDKNQLKIHNLSLDLTQFRRCIIIGGGKASGAMAAELENILILYGKIPFNGVINIPKGLEIDDKNFSGRIKLNFASHPIPDDDGINGVKSMMDLIRNTSNNDLIFCLISGGGSALLPLPMKGLTLGDLTDVNSLLLASGANIKEINTIRKHLSAFKGGRLAKAANKNGEPTIISLIISDVIGNRLDTIASGPTVPDQTTYEDAINYLEKYEIFNKIPESVRKFLLSGYKKEIPETPKKEDPCFLKVHNFIIGSVKDATKAAENYLRQKKIEVKYIQEKIKGEAREYGLITLNKFMECINKKDTYGSNKIALIGTGELTVTIKGKGIGGRNQEMLLGFLDMLEKKKDDFSFSLISGNLDGIEGNSEAMGAIVDNYTIKKYKDMNLNPLVFLKNNDSNTFFKMLKDEIITGYTGINVNDLTIGILSFD